MTTLRYLAVLVVTVGCAHVGSRGAESPRAPAAAEHLPERTLRSILALSSEARAALVQTMVRGRQMTYEVCPVDLDSLKTNAEVLRYLNSGLSTCVNVNALLFDAHQFRAGDIITHLTFRKIGQVAREWVAAQKVPVDFEKTAIGAISIMFAEFRSEPYSGDLNLSSFQLEAREIYVSTLAALIQLLTIDWKGDEGAMPANGDVGDQSPNTLERALAKMREVEPATSLPRSAHARGADVFKLLVEATDRATQGASKKMKLLRGSEN